MAGQIGNNPLDRGIQQPSNQPLDDAQSGEVKRVGTGFGATDSTSLNREGKLPAALQPKKLILAQPDAQVLKNLKPEAISQQAARGQITQITGNLEAASAAIAEHPELSANTQLQEKLQGLSAVAQGLEHADPAILKTVGDTASEIKSLVQAGQLTEGKLQELLSELEGKLQDNSLKFNEQRIQAAKDAKLQKHEERLEKYEKLTEKRSIFDLSHLSPGQKAGAILAMIFTPPAISAPIIAALSIAEAVKGPVGLSMADVSRSAKFEALGLGLAIKQHDAMASKHGRAERAYEGTDIARRGSDHVKMMKMLNQGQLREEEKDKLEKAIQALQAIQAGDVKGASELLGQDLAGEADPFGGKEVTQQQVAEGRAGMFDSHARVTGQLEKSENDKLALQRQTRNFG